MVDVTYQFSGFSQQFLIDGKPLSSESEIEVISLEAGLQASLDWKKEKQRAVDAIQQGKYLLWEFKMGLFSGLLLSLSDETQQLSLSLAVEHFSKTLWKQFSEKTCGVIFYHGSLDFASHFPWDSFQERKYEEWRGDTADSSFLRRMFCQEVCVEYLSFLVSALPEEVTPFVILEPSYLCQEMDILRFSSPESYPYMQVVIKGNFFKRFYCRAPILEWSEKTLFLEASQQLSVGLCLPSRKMDREEPWQKCVEALKPASPLRKKFQFPWLLLNENALTHQWDGLEVIIVASEGVSPQAKRKLHGFCAAGGTVITLDHPQELTTDSLNALT